MDAMGPGLPSCTDESTCTTLFVSLSLSPSTAPPLPPVLCRWLFFFYFEEDKQRPDHGLKACMASQSPKVSKPIIP